jgi:hypothetical protein
MKNIYFIGEFHHEFRQLASFLTKFANGESTVGEKRDWRPYIDSALQVADALQDNQVMQ